MLVAETPLRRRATVGAFFCWNDDVGRLLFHSAYCRRDRRRPLAAFPGLWRFDSIRFVVFARGRNNRIWRWGNNLCVGLARRQGVRRNLCCRCGCACGEFGRGGGVEGRGSCQGVWGGPLGTGPLDPGFRREDGGGERTGKGCLMAEGPLRVPSGQASTGSGRTGSGATLGFCLRGKDGKGGVGCYSDARLPVNARCRWPGVLEQEHDVAS